MVVIVNDVRYDDVNALRIENANTRSPPVGTGKRQVQMQICAVNRPLSRAMLCGRIGSGSTGLIAHDATSFQLSGS